MKLRKNVFFKTPQKNCLISTLRALKKNKRTANRRDHTTTFVKWLNIPQLQLFSKRMLYTRSYGIFTFTETAKSHSLADRFRYFLFNTYLILLIVLMTETIRSSERIFIGIFFNERMMRECTFLEHHTHLHCLCNIIYLLNVADVISFRKSKNNNFYKLWLILVNENC